jgi:hypothetical protein
MGLVCWGLVGTLMASKASLGMGGRLGLGAFWRGLVWHGWLSFGAVR